MSSLPEQYDHTKVEPRIYGMWEAGGYFTPRINPEKKPFSIFLVPPNASGPMHIGNLLMIALQDILARYHRARGEPTLWIPSTDHGGYETQVTFEKELEKEGRSRFEFRRDELFEKIREYVERNNERIKRQIKAAGASVDWSRFRYTMDELSVRTTESMFKKMVADGLIYREFYMVHYCASCGTMLADIEIQKHEAATPLYFVKFFMKDSEEYLTLATVRPEFLFAVTHVLVHPADGRYARHIGKTLLNPITGGAVRVVESKRKFDPDHLEPHLFPFSPSHVKYDYEYAIRHALPSRNLVDWAGAMIERYPGEKPEEARRKEILFLKERGCLEGADEAFQSPVSLCKSGHAVESMIILTWFLKLDDKNKSLKKPALDVFRKGEITVFPRWKEKGLAGWMEKMYDWPIARQNVWGIRIPVWYDVSDPSPFVVWFADKEGVKRQGNLKEFLDGGAALEEISAGLERIYAREGASWALEREAGKPYLPETDTFDTWFSSGNWSTMVFGEQGSPDFSYFYPSDSIIIGHDLMRLSVARKIFLGLYTTGRLPFRIVYLHHLIKGEDGRKMSKSLGNAASPEYYLEKFGADATRMALVSYTRLQDDFIFAEDRLELFQKFSRDLWEMGKIIDLANQYAPAFSPSLALVRDDRQILDECNQLIFSAGSSIDTYMFARGQEALAGFLPRLGEYAHRIKARGNVHISLSVLRRAYETYLKLLHPFMPFMTEELHAKLYGSSVPLADSRWPDRA